MLLWLMNLGNPPAASNSGYVAPTTKSTGTFLILGVGSLLWLT